MWREPAYSGLDIQEPLAERIFYDSQIWFILLIPIAVVIIISSQIKAWFGASAHGKAADNQVRTRPPVIPRVNLEDRGPWGAIAGAIILSGLIFFGCGVGEYYGPPWATILGAVLLLFIALFNEHKVADIQIRAGSSAKPAVYLIVSAIIWRGFVEPWEYALLREKTRPENLGVCNDWGRNDTMLIALGSGLVLFIASFPIYGPIVFRAIRKRF